MDGTTARATLGVSRQAQKQAIDRSFRRRALAAHPDHGGDPHSFARLLEARDLVQAETPGADNYLKATDVLNMRPRVWAETRRSRTVAPAPSSGRSFASYLHEAQVEAGI